MGGKGGNFPKYGDPDISEARKEFYNYQHPTYEEVPYFGIMKTRETTFDLLKRDKNEDILPTDLPLNDDGTINVYALFDVDTGQLLTDIFHSKKEYKVGDKTYTHIGVHCVEKNSCFLVDLEKKVSFPGLERGFDGYLYDVFSFSQKEVVVLGPAGGSIDQHYAVDSAGQKIFENAVSIGKINDHGLEVELLEIIKFTGSQSLSTHTTYLGSDGNKYQKNHSGEFTIIG